MKAFTWTCCLGFGVASFLGNQSAEGRPQYRKFFLITYADEFANVPEAQQCSVCHTDKKTELNNYGDALVKMMLNRKVTDLEKFQPTLREAEQLPSAIEGLTFGDLIKSHRLPASK